MTVNFNNCTENPFKDKQYKYGVENFLIMYLRDYQLVLGADLEYYSKNEEFFNDQNPCNIYFILRRPKVTVDPTTVKISGNKVQLDLIIHGNEEQIKYKTSFKFKKVKSEVKFHSEYPYNCFVISSNENPLFLARPTTLLDTKQLKRSNLNGILDYEVLYIGQAFGKNGERNAFNRLASHSTLQKIYTDSSIQYPDSDIWILLTNFSQVSLLCSASKNDIKVKAKNKILDNQKIENMLENNGDGLKFTKKQKINFTEAALIKYFEPKYNFEFKSSFPSSRHSSYSECYDLDVRAIAIEINTDEMLKIYTNKTGRKDTHWEKFELELNNERFNLFDFQ